MSFSFITARCCKHLPTSLRVSVFECPHRSVAAPFLDFAAKWALLSGPDSMNGSKRVQVTSAVTCLARSEDSYSCYSYRYCFFFLLLLLCYFFYHFHYLYTTSTTSTYYYNYYDYHYYHYHYYYRCCYCCCCCCWYSTTAILVVQHQH